MTSSTPQAQTNRSQAMCCCLPLLPKWLARKFNRLVHTVSLESEDEAKTELLDLFDRLTSKRKKFRYSTFSSNQTSTEFQADAVDGTDWLLTDQLWPTLGEWNVKNLYSQVLQSVVHGIKHEPTELDVKGIFIHLQHVFHTNREKHQKLLQTVGDDQKDLDINVVNLVLNLEIVEGRGITIKEQSQSINPFCTSFINEAQKHNTCMKSETQNPIWREYFSFPVTNCQEDVLHLEVWNYDPRNTLSEKTELFNEMKARSGSLCTMMKEWVDLTDFADKQTHEFLGCLKIPLKNITVDEGLNKWYPLESRSGYIDKRKGEIHLRMGLCAKKEKKVAAQEYRHLLHLLLVHELEEENIQPYQWEGKFAKYAEYILSQFQKHEDLTQMDVDLAKWMVYTRIQCVRPLNAKLFIPIVTNLIQHLQNQSISHYEIRRFWLATEKFIEGFSDFIQNIPDLMDKSFTAQIEFMLQTMSLLKSYLASLKRNSTLETEITPELIIENIHSAIEDRAHTFFQKITQRHLNSTESTVEDMTRVGEMIMTDLIENCETYQDMFSKFLDVKYYDITYRVFDQNYCKVAKPIVQDWDDYLKLRKKSDVNNSYTDLLNITLKLYMTLKEFSKLSLSLGSADNLFVKGDFHNWFNFCVTECLKVKCSNAVEEIKRVVHLDTLESIDHIVHFSDSTIRLAAVFKDMELFWNRLCWPEIEGAYQFHVKIIENLCRYVQVYVDCLSYKVCVLERFSVENDEKYEVSVKLCVAINDIDWMGKELEQITGKLGTSCIWNKLTDKNGKEGTADREKALLTTIETMRNNVNGKITETLQKIGNKMRPVITRLFFKGLKHDTKDGFSKLHAYFDRNLRTLKDNLTSDDLFEKFLYILWKNVSVVLLTEIKKQKPNNIQKQIPDLLQSLMRLFCTGWAADEEILQNSNISEIEDLIKMNTGVCYTTDWIVKYYLERLKRQSEITLSTKNDPFLKVTTSYSKDDAKLFIEILSVQNLKPRDSNAECKPYVAAQAVVKGMLSDTLPKYKTKPQKGITTIFDETFSIKLTPNEMKKDGVIVFSVKDHNTSIIKSNYFMGECFMSLNDIPIETSTSESKNEKKINLLPLTMPNNVNLDSLQALADRPWDKTAVKFVKYERSKVSKVMKR